MKISSNDIIGKKTALPVITTDNHELRVPHLFLRNNDKERRGRSLTTQNINRRSLCFFKGGHFQDDAQRDFKSLQLGMDAGDYVCELEYSEDDQKQIEEEDKEEEEEEAAAAV